LDLPRRGTLRRFAPLALGLLVTASFAYGTGGCSCDEGGCTKDNDCATGRIYGDDGRCVDLETTSSATVTSTTATGGAGGATTATGSGGNGGSAPMCDAAETLCGSVCVDTKTDVKHCGMCDEACPVPASATTATCADGLCGFACSMGYVDCDLESANGCETTLDTTTNCGECGNACSASSQCKVGVCEVCPLKLLGKVNITTGDQPYSAAVTDLNNDGKLDLVVANFIGDSLSVLLGKGDGTFQPKVDLTGVTRPGRISASDLNVDGKVDVIVTNAETAKLSTYFGKGNGTFDSKVEYPTGNEPAGVIRVDDVTGDSRLDLIVSNAASSSVSVFVNNGDGSFKAKVDYPTGSKPIGLTLGELNGDGKSDIVTGNQESSDVSVLLNEGNGTFKAHVVYATTTKATSVALADLNGDKKLDVVAANWGGGSGSTVSVFLGKGDGTLGPKADFMTGTGPYPVIARDIDGDGKVDLAVGNDTSNTVSILLGKGDATFAPKVDWQTGTRPVGMVSGDLNGDGKLDLVAVNVVGNTVSILLNGACTP
jgi:hypothetical protein